MTPCLVWRGTGCHRRVGRARQMANKEIHKSLGLFVSHSELWADTPELFRGDGVLLSDNGSAIFLSDLQQGLLFALGI